MRTPSRSKRLAGALADAALDSSSDDALLNLIGEAPFVLIGEATHGTHEFYERRARITRRLIQERGFTAVCIEGDWPDAYRVNRYARGASNDADAAAALSGFSRFPGWMWRNTVVRDFIEWLREYNGRATADGKVKAGFYGLDLYSMYASIDAVLSYLDQVDPQAAARARRRYECLAPFEEHPERYGYAAELGMTEKCRDEVMHQLLDIQQQAASYASRDGRAAEDQYFYAEQNARIVANAEEYYRGMIDERVSTWNLRDSHMADTLERLVRYLGVRQGTTRAVVWAHNSHIGDASMTSMSMRGETNLGELVRRRHGSDCVLAGFTTYDGTVTAASDWHAPEERKRVRAARHDSYEHVFHELGRGNFYLPLRSNRSGLDGLPEQARERAIGVVYRPQTELQSHYFYADIMQQFDAVYHFDRTSALEPLDRTPLWDTGEPPETYPSGI